MDFHIHNDHYRFGHSDNLIPKTDPAIKDFLKYVAKKKIPDALIEIINDGNIPLYDGNIILRVFDHRSSNKLLNNNNNNSKDINDKDTNDKTNPTNTNLENPNKDVDENAKTTIPGQSTEPTTKKYKEYRTILRLTQSALYEDFCVTTDTQMFGDSFVLTYESEILTASNRSINLQPISNPYLKDKSLWPELEMIKPKYDEENDEMIHLHRTDMRELIDFNDTFNKKKNNSSGILATFNKSVKLTNKKKSINYENMNYKPLHIDNLQSNSKYEKLMLIMSQSLPHSNLDSNKQIVELPRFERLRFIENLRNNNLLNKDGNLRNLSSSQNKQNGGYSSFSSLMNGFSNKSFGSIQNKMNINNNGTMNNSNMNNTGNNFMNNGNHNINTGTINNNNTNNTNTPNGNGFNNDENGNTNGKNAKGKGAKGKGKATTTGKKKVEKPKKPRKPTKKQLAAQAAAAAAAASNGGLPVPEPTEPVVKKKRAPNKKKNPTA